MKKIISLFIILFCAIGCLQTITIDTPTVAGHYHSECSIGNVGYYSNFNVNRDSVEMYLLRIERVTLYKEKYDFGNSIYTFDEDTLYVDTEVYNYNLSQFKDLLIKKNTLPRDTTIFKITLNMYCTWECFDEMYSIYVKD